MFPFTTDSRTIIFRLLKSDLRLIVLLTIKTLQRSRVPVTNVTQPVLVTFSTILYINY